MTWRFRKSFSPFPGIRLTLSPRGVSSSIGNGIFRLTAGTRDTALTMNMFGSGLSYRKILPSTSEKKTSFSTKSDCNFSLNANSVLLEKNNEPESIEDENTNLKVLTTVGLNEFKKLLEQVIIEKNKISIEIKNTKENNLAATNKFNKWKNGWLLKNLLKSKFATLQNNMETSNAQLEELFEQNSLSCIHTHIDVPTGVEYGYQNLCIAFEKMTQSKKIWDTIAHSATNQLTERTLSSRTIERTLVSFNFEKCEILNLDWNAPHFVNANGGDIFLYSAFLACFISENNFALLEYKDVNIDFSVSRFLEEDIPDDSNQIGSTWAKINKDGSPDRRFKGNYEIPILSYGKLVINSETGLSEEYILSNAESAENFVKTWNEFKNIVKIGA
jgi:Protein of unknown function (DUF4236)